MRYIFNCQKLKGHATGFNKFFNFNHQSASIYAETDILHANFT